MDHKLPYPFCLDLRAASLLRAAWTLPENCDFSCSSSILLLWPPLCFAMASLLHGLSPEFADLVREACPGIRDDVDFFYTSSRDYDFVEIYAGFCRLYGQCCEAAFLQNDLTVSVLWRVQHSCNIFLC